MIKKIENNNHGTKQKKKKEAEEEVEMVTIINEKNFFSQLIKYETIKLNKK